MAGACLHPVGRRLAANTCLVADAPSRPAADPPQPTGGGRRPRCRKCRRLISPDPRVPCGHCYPHLAAALDRGAEELFGYDPAFDGPSQLSLIDGGELGGSG